MRCRLSPDCEFEAHAADAHPCGSPAEKPGEPCRYCAKPVPTEGTCPDCWESLDGLPLADLKAIFASMNLSLGRVEE